jgi:hypothetical protein
METRLFIAGRYFDGKQGGRFSMEFWTEPKLVCVAYGEEDRDG